MPPSSRRRIYTPPPSNNNNSTKQQLLRRKMHQGRQNNNNDDSNTAMEIALERNLRQVAEEKLRESNDALLKALETLTPNVNKLFSMFKSLETSFHATQEQNTNATSSLQQSVESCLMTVEAQSKSLITESSQQLEEKINSFYEEIVTSQNKLTSEQSVMRQEISDSKADLVILQSEFSELKAVVCEKHESYCHTSKALEARNDQDKTFSTNAFRSIEARMTELDKKIFDLEKENLKLRLSASSVIPKNSSSSLSITQSITSLENSVASIKDETLACRQADRVQFSSLTNRTRDVLKRIDATEASVSAKVAATYEELNKLAGRVPVEISSRLEVSSSRFEREVQDLKRKVADLSVVQPSNNSFTESNVQSLVNEATEVANASQDSVFRLNERMLSLEQTLKSRVAEMRKTEQEMISLYEMLSKRLLILHNQGENKE